MAKKAKTPEVDVTALLVSVASAPTSKKGKGVPELPGHEALADRASKAYKAMKDAAADYALVEADILAVTGPEYEARSRRGEHSKSFDLPGVMSKGMQVVYQDKFSDLDIAQEAGLRDQLGEKFDTYFEQKRKLTLKEDATDDKTIQALLKLLGPDEFRRIFEVKITLGCKDDMDRKQFEIPEGIRTLAGLKQAKPGVKPIKKGE